MSIDHYGVVMDGDELTAFLESAGLGTLCLGNESGGYGIPMSFGYDGVNERCLFQFAFGEDGLKAQFVEAGNTATLSVHEWHGVEDWKSAVLRGTLHRISDEETAKAAGIFAAQAKIASLEVFRQPLEQVDLEWYELRIQAAEGRQASESRSGT